MTAKEFLEEEKFGYDHFTKLTSTGIISDEDNVAQFAEDYHKLKLKHDMSKDKPSKDQVILFMARNYKYPEIGVFKTYENDCSEIYIPSNDDAEKIENVEWWMEVPE